MRKLFVILAILFIGILVAGCTSNATGTGSYPNTDSGPDNCCTSNENHCGNSRCRWTFHDPCCSGSGSKTRWGTQRPGPFTVFAPTDDAFKNLPPGTVESLLKEPEGQLKQILLYHVVDGKVMAADVVKLSSAKTLQGSNVNITVNEGVVKINDATVKITDIQTKNGVIHVIDKVLIPPK